MDPLAIVRRRLREQGLCGAPFATPAAAVSASVAVQAQEHAEALWSLAMRVRDAGEAEVAAACDRGEIVRTHVLRPTWHFVAAEDLRWLLRLTGPRVQAKSAGRYRELGLDGDTLRRTREVLTSTLADGEPRIRGELSAALTGAGVDTAGQRIAHMLMHAELEGVICSGPRRGRQHTYLSLEGRVPAAPERERADDVAELGRRFFASHGPATLRDFAWWSGLTVADGRAAVAAAGERLAIEVDDDGTRWFSAAEAPRGPLVRTSGALLLGTYDEALVGYRDLRTVGADGTTRNALRIRPIVIDGRTIGTWTRRRARRAVTIEAALDAGPSARRRAALRRAAERYGAFAGLPATLDVHVAPPPLRDG